MGNHGNPPTKTLHIQGEKVIGARNTRDNIIRLTRSDREGGLKEVPASTISKDGRLFPRETCRVPSPGFDRFENGISEDLLKVEGDDDDEEVISPLDKKPLG